MTSDDKKPPNSGAGDLSIDKNGQTGSDSETVSARAGSQLDVSEKTGAEPAPGPGPAPAPGPVIDPSDSTPPPRMEYVKGVKLLLLLAAIIVPYFLMMLDQTILATVSDPPFSK